MTDDTIYPHVSLKRAHEAARCVYEQSPANWADKENQGEVLALVYFVLGQMPQGAELHSVITRFVPPPKPSDD